MTTKLVNILDPEYMLEWARRQQMPVDAVPTPLPGWNTVCRGDGGGVGLAKGWFVIVGANPKHGKTNLALNLAAAAVKTGQPIGIVSLEMADPQLALRFYALATATNIRTMERGTFNVAEFEGMWNRKLDNWNLSIGMAMVGSGQLHGVHDVVEMMQGMYDEGARWIVVDYLQLVSMASEDAMYHSVFEVAAAMRNFATERQCVVIGLSQFNRTTAGNYEQSPRAQGLHGGMILEGTAEQVVLLDHSRYECNEDRPHIGRTWLVVELNRHGGNGQIAVEWDYRTMAIREAMPDEESAWPTHTKSKP